MGRFTNIQIKQIDEILRRRPTVKPFLNDTPEIKQKRKKSVSRQNWHGFSMFCKTYLPHLFEVEFNPDHKEMTEYVLKNVHGITIITGYRGLGKTTLEAIAFAIWQICTGKAQYVIQSAALETKSIKRTRFIYNELSCNVRLKWDYPDCVPVDSTVNAFFLANNTYIEAATIDRDIRGDINPMTGKRPDLIIYDDIDRSRNKGNIRIGRERRDKIKGDGIGALPPKLGRVIVLGNETHINYAVAQFAEEMNPKIKDKHIITDGKCFLRYPVEDKNGKSRWASQYSDSDLAKLKIQMGSSTYQREMLGRKIIEGNYFKYEWFRFWNKLPKFNGVWLYADPSWGEKGCYKAIAVIGSGDDNKYYLIDIWAAQCSNNLFYEKFIKMYFLYKKYKVRGAFETVYGQHKHLKDMDLFCKSNGYPVISHLIKRINNKQNKAGRIEALDTVIESGSLLFCNNEYKELVLGQFLDYPDGYNDIPDAISGAMERFSGYNKKTTKLRRLVY